MKIAQNQVNLTNLSEFGHMCQNDTNFTFFEKMKKIVKFLDLGRFA